MSEVKKSQLGKMRRFYIDVIIGVGSETQQVFVVDIDNRLSLNFDRVWLFTDHSEAIKAAQQFQRPGATVIIRTADLLLNGYDLGEIINEGYSIL
jgi:hypothetical protein